MPTYPNARINFGDILTAIGAKLLADGIVADAAQITWGTPNHVPQFSGPFDILLTPRPANHATRDGGPADFRLWRLVDVWYRSQVVQDPGGGYRVWMTSVFAAADTIINSIGCDGFWPEDSMNNLLTIESIKMVNDAPPDYPTAPGSTYGDYVCTLEVIYYPLVDPTQGVFPVP